MSTLRPYQNNTVDAARASFNAGHDCIVMSIPTGGGKTVIFSYIVLNHIRNEGRAMILCDRKELIKQADKNIAHYGASATIIAPKHKMLKSNLYIASVDTLRNREYPEIDLLIVDEAHKQTFDPIIKKYKELYPDLLVIGATATPHRIGNQQSMDIIYSDIIGTDVSIPFLLEQGFLVPERTYAAKMDLSKIKMKGGDYDTHELFNAFDKKALYADVVGKYKRIAEGTKAICFNVSVEHSMKMCEEFNAAGISARHLEAKSKDREQILEQFSRGEFQVLCNCSVLTTGYDEPSIETIILNRATKSLSLYLQMCGRGARLYPGKENFKIIDMGSNVYEHGLWSDEREWKLQKKAKCSSKSKDAQPMKVCETCSFINPISAKVCGDCGLEFPVKEKKLLDGEFEEIKKETFAKLDFSGMSLKQLHVVAKERGYKPGWAARMHQVHQKRRNPVFFNK